MMPDAANRLCQTVLFSIDGYNRDPRELYEVPEVREWMAKLDQDWPLWFFFLRTEDPSSLIFVTFSLISCRKVGQRIEWQPQEALGDFVVGHLAHADHYCRWLGYSDEQLERPHQSVLSFYRRKLGST